MTELWRSINARLAMVNAFKRSKCREFDSRHGLRFGQLPMLKYILTFDGCTQQEIAQRMHVSPASVAVSAKRMEREGLITRCQSESNARCNRLSLTEKGRELTLDCSAQMQAIDRAAYEGFSGEELESLNDMLGRIAVNLSGRNLPDDIESIFAMVRLLEEHTCKQTQASENNENNVN